MTSPPPPQRSPLAAVPGSYIRRSLWFNSMKRYLDQIPRWQPLSVSLSGVIKRRVWSGDDSAGREKGALETGLRPAVLSESVCVCVLVCGACLAFGWSWRLKPVGIRETRLQMPNVDVYKSIC